MERDRGARIVALVALILGVAGLSIGFAAFSNTLNVSSTVYVAPSADNFKILFSTSNTSDTTGEVAANEEGMGETATLSNDGTTPTVTGLKATFTKPGDTVTYTFYVHNAGKYKAYLTGVLFNNVTDKKTAKICTAAEGTSQDYVDAACSGVSLQIKIGDLTETETATVHNHSLDIDTYETVTVTMTYDKDASIVDGNWSVTFGDISLTYSTVDSTVSES